MVLLLVYLFIALFISFLCSILESVLLSIPLSYLLSKDDEGNRTAGGMIKLKENIDKPLSAILSLNTIAHTVGAAGVGAQAVKVFGQEYFGVVSAILTILILVVTEIIPKTLGTIYNKQLMAFSTRLISAMIFVTYPLVIVSQFITKLISPKEKSFSTSREEISALAQIGKEEGIFGDKENKIIQNLIRLKTVKITEVMTPRIVVAMANEDMMLQDFLKNKEFLHFSRIPVYKEKSDNVTGYVFREQVFEKLAEDQFDLRLKDIKRDIVTFPTSITLFRAWEELLNKKEHISLVADEYGGMDGIATLEDIIEALLGFEIVDEKDKIEDMQQYAMEKWKAKQKKYQILQDLNILPTEDKNTESEL